MLTFQWYHFIFICIIYITYRNSLLKPKDSKDSKRVDNFAKYLPKNSNLDLHILFLSFVPLFIFMSKLDLKVVEHVLSLFSYYAFYKSMQYYIDPSISLQYLLPIVTLTSLTFIQKKIVDISNLSNVYMYIFFIGLLQIVSRKYHTIDVMDQIVLAHVVFYVFKQ